MASWRQLPLHRMAVPPADARSTGEIVREEANAVKIRHNRITDLVAEALQSEMAARRSAAEGLLGAFSPPRDD